MKMTLVYLLLLSIAVTAQAIPDTTAPQLLSDSTTQATLSEPEPVVQSISSSSVSSSATQAATPAPLQTPALFPDFPEMEHNAIIMDSIMLSVTEALDRLFKHNPDLAEARAIWISKRYSYSAAWGDFEPKLVGRYNKQSKGPPDTEAPELKEEYKLGVQGSLITGTQYDVGFNQTNYEHSLEKSNLYFGASVKQPIARGVWFGSLWANQVIAKLDEKKAYQEYRAQLATIIEKLLTAYWDYFYAQRVLEFERQSVDVAQSIFDDGLKRLQQGKLSKLELSKAFAELSIRLSRKMEAMSMERDSKHELALLLADPELLSTSRLVVNPDLEHLNDTLAHFAKDDSLFILNPEYLGQQHEIERLQVIKKAHIDQALPSVNLIGSYGIAATNRSTDMAIQTFKDPDQRDRVISGGIEIEIPLVGSHKERKTVQATEHNIRAARIRLGLMAQQITQLHQSFSKRTFELQKQTRYERTAVQYHHDELSAEMQKLDAGKSNYRLVFEIEEKLREAQRKELEVIRAFELNLVKQQANRGRLLLQYKVESFANGRTVFRNDLLGNP